MTVSTGSVLDLKEISGVNWGDQSVHGNHGVLDDAEMKTVLANGLNVIHFLWASNQSCDHGNTNNTNINTSGTVALWFNLCSTNKFQGLLGKKTLAEWAVNVGYSMNITDTEAINCKVGDKTSYTAPHYINKNTWYFLAMIWSPGNTLDIYLNGTEVAYANQETPANTTASSGNLMTGVYVTNNYLDGLLYHPRILALPLIQPEIAAIYEEEEPWFR